MMNPEGSLSDNGTELQPLSIRVITFDLDNTLWNTSATIAAANEALAVFLNDNGIVQSKRTETLMGELFQQDKLKYCPLAVTEQELGSPVLLTNLRKDALQWILLHDNGYQPEAAKEFANQAFQKVSV
jgi:FMN hydrolase / 5-amino-6-(5-phospho-D-ribitylamino)uracil phosphatase